MKRKILIYVQHLLGVGHLHRVAAIARALARAEFEVLLVSGGYPDPTLGKLDGIRFAQLPPARAADASFRIILDFAGNRVDDAWWEARRAELYRLFDDFRPAAVITELFPYARRPMRHELLPWLAHVRSAKPRPLVLSSVRDILVDRTKPERDLDVLNWLAANYDGTLIHGDPNFIPFEQTFPLAGRITAPLHYTGYIVEQSELQPTQAGRDEVLVSAGGGAVGMPLFRAAIAARPFSQARDLTWRLLVSRQETAEDVAALRELAPDGVIVDWARADFPSMLRHCRLSISKAGYNTVMETLAARTRAVVVPFSGGDETEQALRAELLSQRGAVIALRESDATPAALAQAVDRALVMALPDKPVLDLNGAANTAALLHRLLQ